VTVRDAWQLARRQPMLAVAAVLVTASSLLSAAAGWMAYEAGRDVHHLVVAQEAQRCVNSWESTAEIREAIAIPGEAIIEVATDVDPDQVAMFRAAIDRRVRDAYPNPDCSLADARHDLDN